MNNPNIVITLMEVACWIDLIPNRFDLRTQSDEQPVTFCPFDSFRQMP